MQKAASFVRQPLFYFQDRDYAVTLAFFPCFLVDAIIEMKSSNR
jgi:hypothetical protein